MLYGLSFFEVVKRIFLLAMLGLWGCESSGPQQILTYEGPLREIERVEYYYSEKEKVTVKLTADQVFEFQSGDREFPKGVYIEFYDDLGNVSSTLQANHAYFFKEDNQWRGQGNVEVKNLAKKEQLNTEELFWNPKDKKIFTEKFVTIRQQSDVIYGEGLDASQDLSTYKIRNLRDSELTVQD